MNSKIDDENMEIYKLASQQNLESASVDFDTVAPPNSQQMRAYNLEIAISMALLILMSATFSAVMLR